VGAGQYKTSATLLIKKVLFVALLMHTLSGAQTLEDIVVLHHETRSFDTPAAIQLVDTRNFKVSHGWPLGFGNHLTGYARIDNLTDERYVDLVIVNQTLSQFYEPAPGRNWSLGLRLVISV
jgi:hypothetical protein